MNEKTKTLKEQEDNMDISDGLYTSEEPLNSKTSQTPSQQTGDTAYFTATSAELEEVKQNKNKDLSRQNQGKRVNMSIVGLIIMVLSALIAIIWYQAASSGYCKETAVGCGYGQAAAFVLTAPFFLLGLVILIVSTIIHSTRKTTKSKKNINDSTVNPKSNGMLSFDYARYVIGFIAGPIGVVTLCVGCSLISNNPGAILPLSIGAILTLVAIFCFVITRAKK